MKTKTTRLPFLPLNFTETLFSVMTSVQWTGFDNVKIDITIQ